MKIVFTFFFPFLFLSIYIFRALFQCLARQTKRWKTTKQRICVICCATRRFIFFLYSLFTHWRWTSVRGHSFIRLFVHRQSYFAPNLPINEWNHLVERLNYLLRSIICFQGCWFVWLYYNEHTKLSFHLFDMCLVIAEKRLLCRTLSDVILVVYLILLHFRLVFINGVWLCECAFNLCSLPNTIVHKPNKYIYSNG